MPALPSANPQSRGEGSLVKRGYLEGKTKETIGGYHLVPRALVPRTEVTPMPEVNGGGRGDVRGGGVGASLFPCAGERTLRLGGGRSLSI